MNSIRFYIPEPTASVRHAASALRRMGYAVTEEPSASVTHVLLPVPSGELPPLEDVPEDAILIGGRLTQAERRTIDLLRDEQYLADNAAITAHCAVKFALRELDCTLMRCSVLVIGWGRIGQCLAPLLKGMGACVSVASRRPAQRALLSACSYGAVAPNEIDPRGYRLIVNTAPAPVLCGDNAPEDTVLIDLASVQGICGTRVLWARGLPGKEAPRSAGELIARTVARHLGKE